MSARASRYIRIYNIYIIFTTRATTVAAAALVVVVTAVPAAAAHYRHTFRGRWSTVPVLVVVAHLTPRSHALRATLLTLLSRALFYLSEAPTVFMRFIFFIIF